MRASITTLSVLAVLLSLATFATADLALDDQNIKLAVEKKIDHKDISNGTGHWVEVDKGVVTLTGRVKSVWGKNEAVKRALKVEGVSTVQEEGGRSDRAEDSNLRLLYRLRQYRNVHQRGPCVTRRSSHHAVQGRCHRGAGFEGHGSSKCNQHDRNAPR